MKRFTVLLLAFIMLFSLASCAKDKTLDIVAEADGIVEKYGLTTGLRFSSTSETVGEYLDENLRYDYYGEADFDSVEAYEVYIDQSNPIFPCEFGIFQMKEGADGEAFKAFLEARINAKLENAKSYPDIQTGALKTAKFTVKGNYVWYCAVADGNDDINKTLEGKLD